MKKFIFISALAFVPAIAFAQTGTTFLNVLNATGDLISTATPIVVALALLYFFWGLAKYILNAGDEEKKKEGRQVMIWGIIALFVIVAVWGLVNLIASTFDISTTDTITVPRVI